MRYIARSIMYWLISFLWLAFQLLEIDVQFQLDTSWASLRTSRSTLFRKVRGVGGILSSFSWFLFPVVRFFKSQQSCSLWWKRWRNESVIEMTQHPATAPKRQPFVCCFGQGTLVYWRKNRADMEMNLRNTPNFTVFTERQKMRHTTCISVKWVDLMTFHDGQPISNCNYTSIFTNWINEWLNESIIFIAL